MKKLIAGLMSAALALGCVALPAEVAEKIGSGSVIEASAATYGDFKYSILDDGTVEISGYTGSDSTLTIPGTIDGKKVTSIGGYAFEDCTSLTSITIPNSVTSIGSNAFNYCTSLTSITIPNSVTSIGSNAFNYCTSLTSITIPNSVTSIGGGAFNTCTSLTSITIPNSVTSIGYYAFYGTPWLKAQQEKNPLVIVNGILIDGTAASGNVVIPNSVTSIGNYAFEDCTSLTSITIPNGVTSIGSGAFINCENLKSITIPNSVTSIGDYAFDSCESLTSITIPNSVTSIGDYAFYNCESLTSITIPNSVTSIEDWAFGNCTSLTSITIPNSVTSIGEDAFYGCTSLTSITIPNSVTSIGESAFDGCISLASITIPNSVTSIGDFTFYNCISLTNVYYTGSEAEWNNIVIGVDNENLTDATIHYNYVTAVTVPDAKISQTYTSTGTSFTLNWGKLDGVTGYIVYRFDGTNSKWVKVKTVTGASTTSTTVSGFTPGSVIKFKVNAYITEGGKTYYGKTNDFLYAAALANAKISTDYSSTGTSFTLKWGKVTGATGYKVYKYSGSTGKWVLVKTVTGANTLSTTVSGITPGSVIKFKVNAYLTKGTKTYYGKTNDSLYAAALAPASLKSSYTATTTSASVSWNKVSGATGYKIYKYDSANKKWVLAKTVTSADTTSATVTGLTSKTTTKLKVNAYLTKGTKTYYGKPGTMLSVTTK